MADTKTYRLKPATLARARRLRHPQTPAEGKLWAYLRGAQLAGVKFRRQHPIESFVVDFCCPARRLVVEIDGDSHGRQIDYDRERTARLEELGYRVIRFSNGDVERNLEGVVEVILAACETGIDPHPSPLPKRAREPVDPHPGPPANPANDTGQATLDAEDSEASRVLCVDGSPLRGEGVEEVRP